MDQLFWKQFVMLMPMLVLVVVALAAVVVAAVAAERWIETTKTKGPSCVYWQ